MHRKIITGFNEDNAPYTYVYAMTEDGGVWMEANSNFPGEEPYEVHPGDTRPFGRESAKRLTLKEN